ncbi:unnamed protein product [Cylicostephanus goldi]|uniref:Uncharacterized protein n=1 Tax=Cylicostephanus goldi TaxID=71465 RepID=A0A3P7N669_CYLGO|nr:unnamed protein product [Cylicostephanus goldi]
MSFQCILNRLLQNFMNLLVNFWLILPNFHAKFFSLQLSEEFGASHVPFRSFGFKPDFFACTADAVTTECTFLDQATHTPSETAGSWSILTTFVFSAVRDGYYAELRRQRKTSNAFRNRPSVDVSSDGSIMDGSSRRSVSPTSDEMSQSVPKENANFLLPPTVY